MNIGGFRARGHLKNRGAFFRQERNQFFQGRVAGERRAMVTEGPSRIVDVATDQKRRHFFQPLKMIEEAEIVFDLSMAEIVPIADMRGIQLLKKRAQNSFS